MTECSDLTTECDSRGLSVPSLTLSGPVASGALSSALATVISTQSTDALTTISALSPTPLTIVPANTGAQSTDTLTQSTGSPAQSTNTTSSAKQSCLIPHLLYVQVSVVLLGGLVHLAL